MGTQHETGQVDPISGVQKPGESSKPGGSASQSHSTQPPDTRPTEHTIANPTGNTHIFVLVIQYGHRLAPVDYFSIAPILFDTPEQICWITPLVTLAAVIVKPVNVAS